MTTVLDLNDTTASLPAFNDSDVTTTSELWEWGCGEEGAGCNLSHAAVDLVLCTRLAPPPVPPWLRESPSRLRQLTSHCRSWTLYHELCNTGTGNSTWGYPRHGETTDDVAHASPAALQWVIPALALVVVLLLLLLALVLYKYYSRPNKKSMYRVSGAGYRFKPPEVGSNWARGPMMESETSESYLGQPPAGTGSDLSFARSPVCRLLEQTQFVATPTEDRHRPRPSGPPAFASPAYFLPALSWLRLPILKQAWPGESNGGSAVYNAARPVQCDCGQTTHQWIPEGDGQWTEARTDDDPEYSEIWEGPPQYSSLNQATHLSANGIGPYEYEMQERANGHVTCDCDRLHRRHQRQRRPQSQRFANGEHRYDKLWQCGEGADFRASPSGSSSSAPGTCENGWLSRYRLPSPCISASDPTRRKDRRSGQIYCSTDEGLRTEEVTSGSQLLPCQCAGGVPSIVPYDWRLAGSEAEDRADGRTEVKYINPVYQGHNAQVQHRQSSPPLLNRLWGYMGWNKR